MLRFVGVALICALISTVCAQTSYSVSLNFTGGLPVCSQCGASGQYACSPSPNHPQIGEWNNGTLTFTDPLPAGLFASGITAVVYGSYGCGTSGNAVIVLTLNGEVIDVHQGGSGNQCKCNTCDGGIVFSTPANSLSPTLPYYNSKGTNTVQVEVYASSICVSSIEITINATKASPQILMMELPLNFSDDDCSQSCGPANQCWCANYFGDYLSTNFRDPLPSNTVLLSAAVAIYGYATGSNSYNISASLSSTTVGKTMLNWSTAQNLCAGRAYIYGTDIYQNGWPGYVYGGQNQLVLNPNNNQRFCIGTFILQLYYYSLGSELWA